MSYNEQIFLTDLPEELIPSGLEITYVVDTVTNISKKIVLNNLPISVSTQIALNSKQNLLTNNSIQDSWLSTNVTLQGNTFNGVSQLVKLDGSGKLPAIDGSQLTGLVSAISSLSDVTITSLGLNELLQYNGTKWVNVSASSVGATSLSGLSDVLLNTPLLGQALLYNGTKWVNQAIPNTAVWGGITGTLSAQTDLQLVLDSKASTTQLSTHISDLNNPHAVTKSQVGLGSVDNTSDANKPVSTATQTALDLKQNNLTIDPNEGLELIGSALGTKYNSTIGDSVTSVVVGGAPSQPASTWKNRSIVQVLDTILFPTLDATITTSKSVTLAVNGASGTIEIGEFISRTLTASFVRGTITNGDGTVNANPLVGLATQYSFSGTGISTINQAGSSLGINVAVVSGTNNWAVTVNHSIGTGSYFDNKGNIGTNLDAQRVAGTTTDTTSAPTITGILPFFYLKSSSPITAAAMAAAITAGTATKVVSVSTGTISIPYNMSAQYLAVAYPAGSTTKTIYFVTSLDTGAITLVFNPVTTLSVNSPNGYWTNQSYKIHVSTSAITNSNPTIELRNT